MKPNIEAIQAQAAAGAMHWLSVGDYFSEKGNLPMAALCRTAGWALRGLSGWEI